MQNRTPEKKREEEEGKEPKRSRTRKGIIAILTTRVLEVLREGGRAWVILRRPCTCKTMYAAPWDKHLRLGRQEPNRCWNL